MWTGKKENREMDWNKIKKKGKKFENWISCLSTFLSFHILPQHVNFKFHFVNKMVKGKKFFFSANFKNFQHTIPSYLRDYKDVNILVDMNVFHLNFKHLLLCHRKNSFARHFFEFKSFWEIWIPENYSEEF